MEKSKVIGNHTYYVTMLGAKKSRRVWVRILSMLAPIVGAGLKEGIDTEKLLRSKGNAGVALLSALDVDNFGAALEQLPQSIQEEDLDFLAEAFSTVSHVGFSDGRKLPLTLENQETHFQGRLTEFFRWIVFAVQVNYSDFLELWSAAASMAGAESQADQSEGEIPSN